MTNRLDRYRRALLGERPLALLALAAPTALGLALDLTIRGGSIASFAMQAKFIYASSWLISAAFWVAPLWLACWLLRRGSAQARAATGALFVLWILPFATCAFGGQALYHRVFHSYVGRDTVRLGVALRGTVGDWFSSWGGPWLLCAMVLVGAVIATALFVLVRRTAPLVGDTVPLLSVVTFCAAAVLFWTDQVDSRFLQAATPDACFVHGATHALRTWIEGRGGIRQGMSLRSPAPLPALASARRPNVLLVLTESVRADAMCSDPPPFCVAPFLDAVAADREPLGKLTSQTPNTFSACMILWTGLSPSADFRAAHSAPVLWELARAVGYRTAYVTSQNPNYEDFGTFTRRAGIDVLVTATDLGGVGQEQLGAPDERATAEMLRFIGSADPAVPYFGVLHLSNTHAPYRVDPALAPFTPHATDPLGNASAFHNHYRNSVALQERTVAEFVRAVRALPGWDHTALLFVSDHGEQFREHGGLYHNHSLYDEELRVPGWIVGGSSAIDPAQHLALRSHLGRRTYMQDVHETVVDLLGVEDSRSTLPFASLVTGRSLLRSRPGGEGPTALLATATSVWEPDDARFGATAGERALVGAPGAWACFDMARDPRERSPLPGPACDDLRAAAAPVASAFVGDAR
ncbi:MAG TPA: sulfatase-like hydrolase/transferase [Polyangiaceae bacterium]|nr:sulfatase-like hydrolase/transferase [Polyangiaceae bacterium]